MIARFIGPIVLCALTATCALADFSYTQTSQMTGGALIAATKMLGPLTKGMREPITSTVMVKGNRMVRISKDTAEVIDLDKETITNINFARKTYTSVTFAEMKQAMENAAQKARERGAGKNADSNVDMKFKVDAKPTGQTKQISGLDAKEMIITMTMEGQDQSSGQKGAMVVNIDAWMAPAVPGYDEVRAFHKRMAEKLAFDMGSLGGLGMGQPQISRGMAESAKELAKMDGIPVQEVVSMTGQGEGQPGQASGGPAMQEQQQQQGSSGNSGLGRLGGGLGGLAGGLGGLGRKKNQQQQQQQPDANASQSQTQTTGSLMEMTITMSGFSSGPVDASKFEVPAGFKQTQSALERGR